VYVKGAPEYIIDLCSFRITSNSDPKPFDYDSKAQVLQECVSESMAKQGLKVLTYAFKDVPREDFDNYGLDQESPEFRETLESDLIYISTFGLEDPLRANIEESI
jgi:magnesium-transporting ATPase (P-type)